MHLLFVLGKVVCLPLTVNAQSIDPQAFLDSGTQDHGASARGDDEARTFPKPQKALGQQDVCTSATSLIVANIEARAILTSPPIAVWSLADRAQRETYDTAHADKTGVPVEVAGTGTSMTRNQGPSQLQ